MSPAFNFHEPETATYQWVYVKGQVQVSPLHSHGELLDHAQVDPDTHDGPTAMGSVEVQGGLAGWSVLGNVSLRHLAKVLKEYTKNVGWRWGGLIDHIDQVPVDDQFGPKKSMFFSVTSNSKASKFAHQKYALAQEEDVDRIGQFEYDSGFVYAGLDAPRESVEAFARDTGRKVATLPGGGDMTNMMRHNAPHEEDLEIENLGENAGQGMKHDDPDAPPGSGPWTTRDGRAFTDWGDYMIHVQELNGKTDQGYQEDKFPKAPNMDLPLPNNHTDRFPFVMPLASRQAALAFPDFEEQAPDDEGRLRYAAFEGGAITAMGLIDPEFKEIVWSSGRQSGKSAIQRAFVSHFKLSEVKPKDMLKDPVPFIYDIEGDKIAVGHPGSRHSDIPGKFTPGGIIEGTYQPGGKVVIHTMTNMPYTANHLISLWYWAYPQMEVTSLELEDAEGKTTKLATAPLVIHEVPKGRETHDEEGESEFPSQPIAHFSNPDQVFLGSHGGYHADFKAHPEFPGFKLQPGREYSSGRLVHHPDGKYIDWYNKAPDHAVREDLGEQLGAEHRFQADGFFFSKTSAKLDDVKIAQTLQANVLADPAAHLAAKALGDAGGRVLVVGGAIRDALLGKAPNDVDLMVTGLSPERVDHVLSGLPGRMDLTGKHFGVYRYTRKGYEVEVALPRSEQSTGATQKDFATKVDGSIPVEKDLGRRDFTANAMAFDLSSNELIDPFGGAHDVQERRLRPVFDDTFKEDPTRLLRALTALTNHGLEPDEETKAQMTEHAAKILHEPRERVQKELDKILSGKDPHRAVELAVQTGLMEHIIPEVHHAWDFDQNNHHHHQLLGPHLNSVLKGVADETRDPDLRLAALLHDVGKPGSEWRDPETGSSHFYQGKDGQGKDHALHGADLVRERLTELKYPTSRVDRITHLVKHHMFPEFHSEKGARKFLNRVGDQHADDLLTLRHADQYGKGKPEVLDRPISVQRGLIEAVRAKKQPTTQANLAINGHDITDLGAKGPQVGAVLKHLVDKVIDDPEVNQRPALIGLAQEFLKGGS